MTEYTCKQFNKKASLNCSTLYSRRLP